MSFSLASLKFRAGTMGILALVILSALLLSGARAQVEATDAPPAPEPVDPKKLVGKLVYHFEPCVFSTREFPSGSFQQDEMAQKVPGPVRVETTFYNEKFAEVKEADAPGRYGAVVRITLGGGIQLNRFITLYRAPENAQWQAIGQNIKIPIIAGNSPEVAQQQQDAIATVLKDSMGNEGFSPQIAKLLMGLAKVTPGVRPEILLFSFMARDDAWWFELRKRIGLPLSYLYLVQLPDGYASDPARRWPLILSLHGSGERGDSLANLKRNGLPKRIAGGQKLDAIVISPQCPRNEGWSTPALSQLIDDVSAKYQVDPDRVIVTGLSMGGFGTWALALAYPDRFSAIAPVCGGGNFADAARLAKLPVWAFHGQLDSTVPVQMSEAMIAAIRQAGGAPHLTIYPDARHDSWTRAYATDALYIWMLAQQRGKPEVKTPGLQEP